VVRESYIKKREKQWESLGFFIDSFMNLEGG